MKSFTVTPSNTTTMRSLKLCSFLCVSLLSFYAVLAEGAPRSNETDRDALLEFKSRLTDENNQIFSSWNDTVHFCHWPGITCGPRHQRVTGLTLPLSGLGGSLSPYIGNLSFLRMLDINNNGITGGIPPEIGKLHRLTYLGLENNSISGMITENISGCTKLRDIWLGTNMLVGEIPQGLATLFELRSFRVFKNNLTGNFPEFFGNFSSLEFISVGSNNFYGTVPASLGRLQKLQVLFFGANTFSGGFPSSIFNVSTLEYIEFPLNRLKGSLPSDLGNALPNIVDFNFGYNNLTGPIPLSIANATKLLRFGIPVNSFSGLVPPLADLNRLQWLNIADNQLGRGKQGDLRFIESLNSTGLQRLAFGGNNFGGILPQSIGNLSTQLIRLWFGSNQLTGAIPPTMGNLHNLEILAFGGNRFIGSLPEEVGFLHKLQTFRGSYNSFTGNIPSSVGNLTVLTTLDFTGNNFEGNIPSSLGNCRKLIGLWLGQNNLSGTIPFQVLGISSLANVLDLSQNKLTGALPEEIGNLKNLARLYMQQNRLSGRVPNSLGLCTSLEELSMGNNQFEGNISAFLGPLKGIRYLDLSHNNFMGDIPKFLENFQLTYLDLSFNHLEGSVPNQGVFLNATGVSLMGNKGLCGGIPVLNLPSCTNPKWKHRRMVSSEVIIATGCGIAVLLILLLLLALYICRKRDRRTNAKPQSEFVPGGPFPQISYEDILRATEGFDQKNLIGTGGFGSVYKGILKTSDKVVAIKVLNLKNQASSKSFLMECEALRNVRHRNLVKIITSCSTFDSQGSEFKALVYEYMENGSLEEWLHLKVETNGAYQKLSLIQRLNVVVDIACAVEYLHHDCEPPIIHCDIKPSNILLNGEMTAQVSDFGLARILLGAKANLHESSNMVRGTIGYSPPGTLLRIGCPSEISFSLHVEYCAGVIPNCAEYGMGSQVSREGDIYSFGILLLEMFTGKRPTDNMFEDAWNIQRYCEAAFPERVLEISDPALLHCNEFGEGSMGHASRKIGECLAEVFEVGMGCCRESPGERMDIRKVAAKLRSINSNYLCD